MLRTLIAVFRFCSFYLGLSSGCKKISPGKKHHFLSQATGQNCPKCGIVMRYYNGVMINHKTHYDAVTVGHILPQALGGSHSKWLIQPECKICNAAHGAVLAELIHKYGLNKWDVPFFVLLQFVVYGVGQVKSSLFTEFDNEFERHALRLRKKAEVIE